MRMPLLLYLTCQVVRALDSLDELADLNNGMKPGQSSVFDSAQQSAQIRMFRRMAFGSQDYSSSFFNDSQSSWRSREQEESSTIFPRERSGPWNVWDESKHFLILMKLSLHFGWAGPVCMFSVNLLKILFFSIPLTFVNMILPAMAFFVFFII